MNSAANTGERRANRSDSLMASRWCRGFLFRLGSGSIQYRIRIWPSVNSLSSCAQSCSVDKLVLGCSVQLLRWRQEEEVQVHICPRKCELVFIRQLSCCCCCCCCRLQLLAAEKVARVTWGSRFERKKERETKIDDCTRS